MLNHTLLTEQAIRARGLSLCALVLNHLEEERDVAMVFLRRFLVFDPLHSDPRFQALLQRMNFPQAQS